MQATLAFSNQLLMSVCVIRHATSWERKTWLEVTPSYKNEFIRFLIFEVISNAGIIPELF